MNSASTINIVDIGSSKIQCLITQPNIQGELEVIGYASQETPTSVLSKGQIVNIDKTAKIIREVMGGAEMMAGIEVTSCYANIPGMVCEGIRSHGLIAITPKNGEKKVELSDLERVIDIAESTPLPKDHMIVHSIPIEFRVDGEKVDEDPLGISGMRLETDVYLITCSKLALDTINRTIEKAGYQLLDLMSEHVTCAEGVLSQEEKKSGSLVIDIGGYHTNATLYHENSVNYTLTIPWGGVHLTRDLSMGLSTSIAEADEIKKKYGILDYQMVVEDKVIKVKLIAYQKKTHISQRAIFQILEARMTEIFELVKKELQEQEIQLPLGCCVVLTGATANIPGIDVVARGGFNLAVRTGHPLGIRGIDQNVINPAFSTSFGIAQIVFNKMQEGQQGVEFDLETRGDGVFKKIGSSIKNFFT